MPYKDVHKSRREREKARYAEDQDYREKMREKSRQYRRNHPNLYKNVQYRQQKLAYMNERLRELRELEKIDPQNPQVQDFRNYHREYSRVKQAIQRRKLRQKVLHIFGTKCCLCGIECAVFIKKGIKLEMHEIHGIRHPNNNDKHVIEHKEDYAPLCTPCHRMVSRMMKLFGLNWQQILSLKNKSTPIAVVSR